MKKIGMLLAIVGVMMFTFAGSAMAETETLDVTATVLSHAAITGMGEGDEITMQHSGAAATSVDATCDIDVETNYAINVSVLATTLTLEASNTLTTSVQISNDGGTTYQTNWNQDTKTNKAYKVKLTGTTGDNIKDQAAGQYTSDITVTVAAQT